MSSVEGNGSASISFVAVVKVSNTVQDLDIRLATSLSKELSNAISSGSFIVCEVVKPALTGPKGDETVDVLVTVTECLCVTNCKCLVLTLLLHCCLGSLAH